MLFEHINQLFAWLYQISIVGFKNQMKISKNRHASADEDWLDCIGKFLEVL